MLFAFDLRFTKQKKYEARIFAKVHTTYHVLEVMNTLHVQMAKATLPNFECAISRWRLHQIGRFRFMYLYKIDCVQIALA